MADNSVFAERLLELNGQCEESAVHDLITEVIALSRRIDQTVNDDDKDLRRIRKSGYPGILQMLESYVSVSDPDPSETEHIVSMLEFFLKDLRQIAEKAEEKNRDELQAEMKMLDALLGKDGLNSEFDINHGKR